MWDVPLGWRADPGYKMEWGSTNFFGGVLLTGDLVFVTGTDDAHILAYNTQNGALVWNATLPTVPKAAPITYRVNRKQYLTFLLPGKRMDYLQVVSFSLP